MAIPKRLPTEQKEKANKNLKKNQIKEIEESKDNEDPTPPIGGGVQFEMPLEEVELVGENIEEERNESAPPLIHDNLHSASQVPIFDPTIKELETTKISSSRGYEAKTTNLENIQDSVIDNFERIKSAISKPNLKASSDSGVISVIFSSKNGRRVTFPDSVLARLNNPSSLSFGFDGNRLVVGEKNEKLSDEFPVKIQGRKRIIYSASLVQEITKEFNLDFTGRVSLTFHQVEYITHKDQIIAYFDLTEK